MPRNFMYYIIFIVILAIDQGIKIVVRSAMEIGEGFNIIGEFFRITYIENRGISFGMMEGNKFFLLVLPTLFLIGIFFIWKKYRGMYEGIFSWSISMIMAGGVSNLIDRALLGSVTDYLDLKGFAVFNFADMCTTVGCIMLCVSICFFEKKEKDEKDIS